jgi:hypothetical protein
VGGSTAIGVRSLTFNCDGEVDLIKLVCNAWGTTTLRALEVVRVPDRVDPSVDAALRDCHYLERYRCNGCPDYFMQHAMSPRAQQSIVEFLSTELFGLLDLSSLVAVADDGTNTSSGGLPNLRHLNLRLVCDNASDAPGDTLENDWRRALPPALLPQLTVLRLATESNWEACYLTRLLRAPERRHDLLSNLRELELSIEACQHVADDCDDDGGFLALLGAAAPLLEHLGLCDPGPDHAAVIDAATFPNCKSVALHACHQLDSAAIAQLLLRMPQLRVLDVCHCYEPYAVAPDVEEFEAAGLTRGAHTRLRRLYWAFCVDAAMTLVEALLPSVHVVGHLSPRNSFPNSRA